MRIAIGSFMHETNTFAQGRTSIEDFRAYDFSRGEEMLQRWQGATSEIWGFLQAARRLGVEVVPILSAQARPGGRVSDEAFEEIVGAFLEGLQGAGPLDGLLVALHGAMVTESLEDAEGEFLERLRPLGLPVVATLDFHANLTRRMVEGCTALVGYDTYPHVDLVERGMEAMEILVRTLRGEIRPTVGFAKRPMLIPPFCQATSEPPMRELLERAHRREREEGMVAVTVSGGFCYADIPHVGLAVTVVANGDGERAQEAAEELAQWAWEERERFVAHLPGPEEAVAEAMARVRRGERPIVLADVGDNIGGGTPGDGTVLLEELLRQGAQEALVVLADPEAVSRALQAGVRTEVELEVGGKSPDSFSRPLPVRGWVRLLSDGFFLCKGPMWEGRREDMGRTAVLQVEGVTLVLTERRQPPWNLQQLRSLGLEPSEFAILTVKSAIAFRAAYEPIAAHILYVDTPGLTAANLTRFPYRRIPRPIFPLDPFPTQA